MLGPRPVQIYLWGDIGRYTKGETVPEYLAKYWEIRGANDLYKRSC